MLVHKTFLILALSCGLLNAAVVQERNNSNQNNASSCQASASTDSGSSSAVSNTNTNSPAATVTPASQVLNKHRGGNQAGASSDAASSVAASDTASSAASDTASSALAATAADAVSSSAASSSAASSSAASSSAAVGANGAGAASENSTATSTTNSGNNKAANGGGNAAAASLTLDANAVQTGSQQNGLAQAEAGQAASDTDNANFINFCAGKTLTNGLQVKGGSCNGIVMGDIPSSGNMISSIITNPGPGDTIAANTDFTINVQVQNLVAGSFTNPETTYYSAPQQLKGGNIVGHTHVTVQSLGGNLQTQTPPDPATFAFFKGINDAGNGKGGLSAAVAGGLPAGVYRVCTMTSASNHQPVTMPVAQRGAQDDCNKFTVTAGGAAAGNNSAAGNAAAGNAASSTSAAATSASSAAGAGNAGGSGGGNATTTTNNGGKKGSGQKNGRSFVLREFIA